MSGFWRSACDTVAEGNKEESWQLVHDRYALLPRGMLDFWKGACDTVPKGSRQEGV